MAPPLRVLVMNSLAPPFGGAEAHVADLTGLLAEHGVAVETYVPPGAKGATALRDKFVNPDVRRATRERIAAFRPDVVHVHNFLRRLSVAPFLAAKEAGVATLLTVHDFQLFCPRTWALRADGSPCEEPKLLLCALGNCRGGLSGLSGRAVYAANTLRQRMAARVVRRDVTRVVAPSAALATRLTRTLARDVGVLPLVPAPAPVAEFRPPSSRDLLFAGRLSDEKGLAEFLAAMDPAQRLTVAGDGPLEPRLRAIAAQRRLDVRFAGRLTREEVASLLAAHGALVLPSVWMENSPLSILEALAAGRPVLASRRGGIPELVEDGATGLLFEPRDAASVEGAVRRYRAMSDAEHAAMARRAWEEAAARADRGAAFARIAAEYREAAARARKPA